MQPIPTISRPPRRKVIRYSIAVIFLILVLWITKHRHHLQISRSRSIIKNIKKLQHGQHKELNLSQRCELFFHRLELLQPQLSIVDKYQKYERDETLVESMNKIKIFNKCYLEKELPVPNQLLERQFYPFFKNDQLLLPKFETPDDENKPRFPVYSYNDNNKIERNFINPQWDQHISYWNNMKRLFHGEGIAITIHRNQMIYMIRLLKVLATLNNHLPIEIIYKDDIEQDVRDYILLNSNGQMVTFVNVLPLIDTVHLPMFKSYSNKWLALLFCSFENVLLMDVDSIPFIEPVKFFEMDGYRNHGFVLFKDRFLPDEMLSNGAINLYKKMLPGEEFFEINGTQFDKSLLHSTNLKHILESGIVIINKKSHLSSLLISTVLQFWYKTSIPVLGDKELFWLGHEISGTSSSLSSTLEIIHPVNASIIGSFDPNTETICSTQIAHLNQDGNLLWLNGGLLICKRSYFLNHDFDKNEDIRLKYLDVNNLRNHYESPLYINGSIIPYEWGHTKECIGYQYCVHKGVKYQFGSDQIDHYNKLVEVWNENV